LVGNYFTTEFILQVVSYNIPDYSFGLASKSTNASRTAIPGNIIRVMMYAVQKIQKKIPVHCDMDFRKDGEYIHSLNESMRAIIVKNLALNVAHHSGVQRSLHVFQKNTPKAFMNTEQGNIEESSQNVSSGQHTQSQPTSLSAAHSAPSVSWLASGFFKQKHFESSASTDEVLGSYCRPAGSEIQVRAQTI
jgi:phage-related protein